MRRARNTSALQFAEVVANGMALRPPELPRSLQAKPIAGLRAVLPAVDRALVSETSSDIPVGDWDILFNAVKERLVRTANVSDTDSTLRAQRCALRIRTEVLDCVAALDQLQATVTVELKQRQRLELEVFDVKASLAQIRAALIGSHEGERRVRHHAAHHGLTLLPHRAALVERITQELGRSDADQHSFAMMCVHLDGFNLIKDMYGHAAGDDLLRIIATRLRRVVRAQDLVSRVGADEFACLIGGNTDQTSLANLADKLADAVAAHYVLGPFRLTVRVTIGIAVALCPIDGNGADALLAHADLAMVAAKRQQARYAFFSRDGDGS